MKTKKFLVFTTVGTALSTSYLWVPVVKEKIEDHKMSKRKKEESMLGLLLFIF